MRRRVPLLVTGLPRSGTTWVARMLAEAPGTAMLGREPMNPREGQFALGGTARAWVAWDVASPRQARVLARTYRGWEPRTYGRLGVRQWRAPSPTVRVVVKDPFALLSLAAVAEVTGAQPVVVFRTAAATLASYRRMGWRADLAEVAALGGSPPAEAGEDDAVAMGYFWQWAYRRVLDQLDRVPDAVLVSHAELTAGGDAARRALFSAVGLSGEAPVPARSTTPGATDERRLHNFDRSPDEVMSGWQERLTSEEVALLDEVTGSVQGELAHRRLLLPP